MFDFRRFVHIKWLVAGVVAFSPPALVSADELASLSLEDLLSLDIGVASHVVRDARLQPASISIIPQNQIRLSGARTLSELLTIYVPGYFLVEDQDDTIAGFRGVVADNNSKIMLLLNGQNINTEWFWGPADAVLNGIDLDYIERVEVIRGPGSVTLGQGALLGVINIITHQASEWNEGLHISAARGNNDLNKERVDLAYLGHDTRAYAYVARTDYAGVPLPAQGNVVNAVEFDQGLSVAERNHHLKRAESTNIYTQATYQHFQAQFFRFEQVRDLYSWKRDREQVEQILEGASAAYTHPILPHLQLQVQAHYQRDDYALYSHGENLPTAGRQLYESTGSGFADITAPFPGLADAIVEPGVVMGGVREQRRGAKIVVNWDELMPGNRLAFGLEWNHYRLGQTNAQGNNFIINEQIQRLGITTDDTGTLVLGGQLNALNTWVKPDQFSIRSLFLEDFHTLTSAWTVFGAFRWDDHPHWGSQLSPRLGLLYDPNPTHLWRLSWQSGFRGAVGVQYAGGFVQDGFLAESNFDAFEQRALEINGTAPMLDPLSPETIQTLELAYRFEDRNLSLSSILFYNRIEDILVAQGTCLDGCNAQLAGSPVGNDVVGTWGGNWYYQNENGTLEQIGLELDATYRYRQFTVSGSHAHVSVLHADADVLGIYVLPGDKTSVYPEDVTRLQLTYTDYLPGMDLSAHLNHVYAWRFISASNTAQPGFHLTNLGLEVRPLAWESRLSARFQVKNLWDEDALYPYKLTGDPQGVDGVPAIESRSWWLTLSVRL